MSTIERIAFEREVAPTAVLIDRFGTDVVKEVSGHRNSVEPDVPVGEHAVGDAADEISDTVMFLAIDSALELLLICTPVRNPGAEIVLFTMVIVHVRDVVDGLRLDAGILHSTVHPTVVIDDDVLRAFDLDEVAVDAVDRVARHDRPVDPGQHDPVRLGAVRRAVSPDSDVRDPVSCDRDVTARYLPVGGGAAVDVRGLEFAVVCRCARC